jgi:hypothetical protein
MQNFSLNFSKTVLLCYNNSVSLPYTENANTTSSKLKGVFQHSLRIRTKQISVPRL